MRRGADSRESYLCVHYKHASVGDDLFCGGLVPYVGNLCMQLHHPAVAHPDTRHGSILLLRVSCGRRSDPVERYSHNLHRFPVAMGVYALDHDCTSRPDDAHGTDIYQAGKGTYSDTLARH